MCGAGSSMWAFRPGMVNEDKMPRLLPWRELRQGLAGSETPMNTRLQTCTNEICMIQQQLILDVETRGGGLGCRRCRRQLGGVHLQARITAQTCLSDLSSLGLTRAIRY